jgi:hypothetical protein
VSALILDAGALVGVDRNDPDVAHLLRRAQQEGLELRTNPMVVAQVWRDRRGRQANLARLLQAVQVRPVQDPDGRQAGALLGRAGTSDPIDATVVLLADAGDRILTSDPGDLTALAEAARSRAVVVGC